MGTSKNDLKLMKTSLRYQSKEYFDNSTLHGVPYIAESGRPFRERFMWFCCTTAGAVVTMVIISSLWEKFQTNPTITGLDTDFHSWEVPFPTITICEVNPLNTEKIDDLIERNWGNVSDDEYTKITNFYKTISTLSYRNMKQIKKFITDDKFSLDNFQEVIYGVVNHCSDFLHSCRWLDNQGECCTEFLPIITENGFCYIFNSNNYDKHSWIQKKKDPFELLYIQETDENWSIVFDSNHNRDINVYIHSAEEIPGYDMRQQHKWNRRVKTISFSVKYTYTTDVARQLSIRQRRCVFSDEIHLITNDQYTYYACTRQCRMYAARRLCGCVPFFYPKKDGFKYCTLKELKCIANNVKSITKIRQCNCELSCTNTVYEIEKLVEVDAATISENVTDLDPLEIKFVSWPMVRYKREVIFGWVDLVVSFGGIAGLFLGFSLLSGVEIIYYFSIRACCMFYRDKDELRKFEEETSKEQITDVDMSLKPYFVKGPDTSTGMRIFKSNMGIEENQVQPFPPLFKKRQAWDQALPPFGIEYLP